MLDFVVLRCLGHALLDLSLAFSEGRVRLEEFPSRLSPQEARHENGIFLATRTSEHIHHCVAEPPMLLSSRVPTNPAACVGGSLVAQASRAMCPLATCDSAFASSAFTDIRRTTDVHAIRMLDLD